MFEKLGATFATLPNAVVHIIGFPSSQQLVQHENLQLHAHTAKPFGRLSHQRITAPVRILFKLLQLKPRLLIITTHELLAVALWCKFVTGCRLVYDVQENYYFNIRFTKSFPVVIRQVLALAVRFKEYLTKPFIDYYFLAERGYVHELRFARPYLVLENKLPQRLALKFRRHQAGNTRLIFSGTLSETTGVIEAIELAAKLHQLNPAITLTVIGNSLSLSFLALLKRKAETYPFIRLKVSEYPFAHEQILEALGQADAGIIIYPPNPSTASSIPTKLYEYLAVQLPVIIRHNEASHQLVNHLKAGVLLTTHFMPETLLASLREGFKPLDSPLIYWESAENELAAIIKRLIL